MVLVTGATGLLGSQICKKLVEEGREVLALKRTTSDTSLLEHINVTWVEGDVLDITTLFQQVQKADIIIHCAAVVSFHKADHEAMAFTNIEGTRNVVDACIEAGNKKLIHISSIAAFGRNKINPIITEKTTWVDSPLNTTYAVTKYGAELEAWRGAHEGVAVAVVNPSVILAPGKHGESSAKLLEYVRKGSKFYTDQSINYVDVRDVAAAVYEIYKSEIYDESFILNAGKVKYKTLFDQAAKYLNVKPPTTLAKGWMLRVAMVLENIKYWTTGVKPNVTKELLKTTKVEFEYQNEKSIDRLGLTYKSLEETLRWSCAELQKNSTK